MDKNSTDGDQLRTYYERTSDHYDMAHVMPGDEHYVALEYTVGLARMFDCKSVLDVGAGTGRALRFLAGRLDGVRAVGVEPSEHLRAQAVARGLNVIPGDGGHMPFADGEFDMVIATGVMHHVKDADTVAREMTRVASKLVMISDANRFGQGSAVSRVAKLMIHKVGLWPTVNRARTRGKGYLESEGDGIFYSYSVFDSRDRIAQWADRTFVIPTRPVRAGFFGSLTESTHALLVGVREPSGPGWAGL